MSKRSLFRVLFDFFGITPSMAPSHLPLNPNTRCHYSIEQACRFLQNDTSWGSSRSLRERTSVVPFAPSDRVQVSLVEVFKLNLHVVVACVRLGLVCIGWKLGLTLAKFPFCLAYYVLELCLLCMLGLTHGDRYHLKPRLHVPGILKRTSSPFLWHSTRYASTSLRSGSMIVISSLHLDIGRFSFVQD